MRKRATHRYSSVESPVCECDFSSFMDVWLQYPYGCDRKLKIFSVSKPMGCYWLTNRNILLPIQWSFESDQLRNFLLSNPTIPHTQLPVCWNKKSTSFIPATKNLRTVAGARWISVRNPRTASGLPIADLGAKTCIKSTSREPQLSQSS